MVSYAVQLLLAGAILAQSALADECKDNCARKFQDEKVSDCNCYSKRSRTFLLH